MKFSLASTDNPLLRKLRSGELVVGTWVSALRDPLLVRLVAWAGFDYVFIDMEHSGITESTLMDLCLVARECGVTPIVRPVNPNSLARNGRLLDIGAAGLIIPHVENASQAREIIASTKFFDGGTRGYCSKTLNSGFERNDAAALRHTDENTVLVAQFEDPATIAVADSILSLPGVSMAIVGRGDLAHGMGLSGKPQDERVAAEVEKVIASCRRNNVAPGLLVGGVDEAREWIARGMRCITYSNEVNLLQNAYASALKDIRACAK